MNIAVISPSGKGEGNTSISGLIGLELSDGRNKRVCLTHTSKKAVDLKEIFKIRKKEEKGMEVNKVVDMIRTGLVEDNEIDNYCRSVNKSMDLFGAFDSEYESENLKYILNNMHNKFDYEYIIYDMDNDDMYSEENKAVLSNADCVVINITQSNSALRRFKEDSRKFMKFIGKVPVVVVVNKYCDLLGDVSVVQKQLGIRDGKKWCTVRYNPWIGHGCNVGELQDIYKEALKGDYRLVEIRDIQKVVDVITKIKAVKRKLEMEEKIEKLSKVGE